MDPIVITSTRIGLALVAAILAVGMAMRLLYPDDHDTARQIMVVGFTVLLALTWVREFLLLRVVWRLSERRLVVCSVATLAILGTVMLIHFL